MFKLSNISTERCQEFFRKVRYIVFECIVIGFFILFGIKFLIDYWSN